MTISFKEFMSEEKIKISPLATKLKRMGYVMTQGKDHHGKPSFTWEKKGSYKISISNPAPGLVEGFIFVWDEAKKKWIQSKEEIYLTNSNLDDGIKQAIAWINSHKKNK